MSCTIDIDEPASWPEPVRRETERMAELLDGTTRHTNDLRFLDEDYDDKFRQLLAGHRLRAYHATRLLPDELDAIRAGGLRLLTRNLVDTRIRGLGAARLLPDEELKQLRSRTVLEVDDHSNRENRICFVIGEESFAGTGLARPLQTWGGEAIFQHVERGSALRERLRSFGEPALVVVQLDGMDAGRRVHAVWPELAKHFVGTLLDLEGRGGDVHYAANVPAENIEAVLRPGDPAFDDRFPWL